MSKLPKSNDPSRRTTLRHGLALGLLALLPSCQRKRKRSYAQRHGIYYKVKPGDTLHHIADACGLPLGQLMAANNISHANQLKAGMALLLPHMDQYPPALMKARHGKQPWMGLKNTNTPDLDQGYSIITRQEWNAAKSKSNTKPMGQVQRVTLHHTSEYPGMNDLSDLQVVRAIANYHRNKLKWADIGYHYLIGRDGRVYEGRPTRLQGAHTGGHNENNLGISVIGHFTDDLPSPKQLQTLERLLANKLREYNLSSRELFGHRDFKPTQCPGESLYRWLKQFKNRHSEGLISAVF